jgi:hypothetical protein
MGGQGDKNWLHQKVHHECFVSAAFQNFRYIRNLWLSLFNSHKRVLLGKTMGIPAPYSTPTGILLASLVRRRSKFPTFFSAGLYHKTK